MSERAGTRFEGGEVRRDWRQFAERIDRKESSPRGHQRCQI